MSQYLDDLIDGLKREAAEEEARIKGLAHIWQGRTYDRETNHYRRLLQRIEVLQRLRKRESVSARGAPRGDNGNGFAA
jgi:hypothetical protein